MGVSTEHFTERELACPCCGVNRMDAQFMDKVETLRGVIYKKFMILSSAYRCPAHNRKVSSTGANGPHTTGRAIDTLVSGEDAYAMLDAALTIGFTGVGINQKGPHGSRFLHLDDLPNSISTPRPRIWSY